jgi:hypothetical protein
MLAFKPTDFHEGLRCTYRTYLKKHESTKPDFTFEDQLISRFSRSATAPRTA